MELMYTWLRDNLANKGYNPKKILDIGAWNGFWTKNCRTFWPDSHYTCIEAGEKHKKSLEDIADRYFINVLGDTNKEIDFYINPVGYTKGASIFPSKNKKIDRRLMMTLESVVGDDSFDFIKQDAQGSEMLIIQGSVKIFQKADYVLNEVNLDKIENMPSLDEMNDYMKMIGFPHHRIIAEHQSTPKQVDVLYCKKII